MELEPSQGDFHYHTQSCIMVRKLYLRTYEQSLLSISKDQKARGRVTKKGEACRGFSRDTLSFCICLVITQNINVHLHSNERGVHMVDLNCSASRGAIMMDCSCRVASEEFPH